MISKQEILELATQANVQTHVIEKDYVLGWLLAGINQHTSLHDAWVFKGGTCLKKCYFETYRFSEDLDFTLLDPSHVHETLLLATFTEIAEWVYEVSGVEIPPGRLKFEVYTNPNGVTSCQGRVYYKGPATYSGKQSMPRIKLDLSADEVVVEPPVEIAVRHGYSDSPTGGISIQSYSYAEVFAEKIRALQQRTRPRDLYDVVTFFRRPESRQVAKDVKDVLTKKCQFKRLPFPSLADLELHKQVCAAGWKEQLSHQLQALPPFDSYWSELGSFFAWIDHPEAATVDGPPAIPSQSERETPVKSLASDTPNFGILDRVRFAAVSRLCVELDYRNSTGQASTQVIEPYSLRTTRDGHTILYGVEIGSGEIVTFLTPNILAATIRRQSFLPRFLIDFIPDGPARLRAR